MKQEYITIRGLIECLYNGSFLSGQTIIKLIDTVTRDTIAYGRYYDDTIMREGDLYVSAVNIIPQAKTVDIYVILR